VAHGLDVGIVINVLTNRDKADQVDAMLADFPTLPVVLDHCLNLKVGPEHDAILEAVLFLSRRPNLHAKVTFVPPAARRAIPARTCTRRR
jgi:predicted TIM-barrel fold metal-dependent hydrolase